MLAAAAAGDTQVGLAARAAAVQELFNTARQVLLIPAAVAAATIMPTAARAVLEVSFCATPISILMQPALQGHQPTLLPAVTKFTNGFPLALGA